jgi:hypothetical protein
MFSFLYNNPSNEMKSLNGQLIPVVFPNLDNLPKSAQGYTTNNKYPDFPPLMADGRSMQASWQPEADANNAILQRNNIKSNWEYRQFLTNNAPEIMRQNFIESATDVGYYERNNVGENSEATFQPISATSMSRPFLYSSILEPAMHLGNVDTDLKMNYLSREQLQAQQFAPVVTQDELLRMKQDMMRTGGGQQ